VGNGAAPVDVPKTRPKATLKQSVIVSQLGRDILKVQEKFDDEAYRAMIRVHL
jgi:hypothetical protein